MQEELDEEYIIHMDDLELLEDGPFDPTDPSQFIGYTFKTRNCTYIVNLEGRVLTRPRIPRIHGLELKTLAGITQEDISEINRSYKALPKTTEFIRAKHYLESTIQGRGRMPVPGLVLVMTTTDERASITRKNGGYMSILKEVTPP
ncbi:TPA: hypothetical protein HA265_03330 [Candidatus Woesearchaeota archaeon]|nr:hypothetical protein [Candidatus Woesearchaeota archaeon]